ncbi:DUF6880 family protein [Oceanospirillum sediminis]|uniref:Uncharacterized protein n=1 Tax=Oceanospirillum sediminis TaxID=2760088 RepID=A0A839IQ03_9GAMM|nr:DUF6880 family protein [Oceanospirillum sediminis]MBB1486527.1 hypothetical protein [Oceanospirillum sediminis]
MDKALTRNLEQVGYDLLIGICYPLLLSDILNAGRSKAYDYAADYYRHLERLDEKIDDYPSLTDRSEFKDQLEQKHGRKYSFWNRL